MTRIQKVLNQSKKCTELLSYISGVVIVALFFTNKQRDFKGADLNRLIEREAVSDWLLLVCLTMWHCDQVNTVLPTVLTKIIKINTEWVICRRYLGTFDINNLRIRSVFMSCPAYWFAHSVLLWFSMSSAFIRQETACLKVEAKMILRDWSLSWINTQFSILDLYFGVLLEVIVFPTVLK